MSTRIDLNLGENRWQLRLDCRVIQGKCVAEGGVFSERKRFECFPILVHLPCSSAAFCSLMAKKATGRALQRGFLFFTYVIM